MGNMHRTLGRRPQDRAACFDFPAAVAAGSLLLVIVLAGCGALGRRGSGGAAGPGTGQAIPVGSSSHAISVRGASRTFGVYRPATLPAPAPLVVMLHGGFGSGSAG